MMIKTDRTLTTGMEGTSEFISAKFSAAIFVKLFKDSLPFPQVHPELLEFIKTKFSW